MESELKMRETVRKTVSSRLYAGCSMETAGTETDETGQSFRSEADLINHIWEENRRHHAESERQLLYPTGDSICHAISFERIVHSNAVAFSRQRYLFKPVIAEETRQRYKHFSKVTRQYKRLVERWRSTHNDEEDSDSKAPRGWKEDGDGKRDKRAACGRAVRA